MKFKRKNKQNKVHVRFDEKERKEYLLGFRKRKLERKQKAKLEMAEKYKKEKREVKRKRLELIKKMIDDRSTKFEGVDSDDEADSHLTETKVTDYDDCTVEVSNIDLQTKSHIGSNTNKISTKPSEPSEEPSDTKCSFKLPEGKYSNKLIKTNLWKSAAKFAKKTYEREKKNKKKKKVLVTEL